MTNLQKGTDGSLSERAIILLSCVIGVTFFLVQFHLRVRWESWSPAADAYWPYCAAVRILEGRNPYPRYVCAEPAGGQWYPQNMLPTGLLLTLLVPLGRTGPSLLWGVGNGFLSYGLLKRLGLPGLLLFFSFSYWDAFYRMQWSPLILAIALLPRLYLFLWLKPPIALPVAILRFHVSGFVSAAFLLVVSFLVLPQWLTWFLSDVAQTYSATIPVLESYGVLLFLPLILSEMKRHRTESRLALSRSEDPAWWLALYSVCPLRIYDLNVLWICCKCWWHGIILFVAGWIGHFTGYEYGGTLVACAFTVLIHQLRKPLVS